MTTTTDAAKAGHDQAVTTITRQADAGMTRGADRRPPARCQRMAAHRG